MKSLVNICFEVIYVNKISCDELPKTLISKFNYLKDINDNVNIHDYEFLVYYNDLFEITKRRLIHFGRNYDEIVSKIRWHYLTMDQKMSIQFIRKFKDRVNWGMLSLGNRSEEFIREFQNYVHWKDISLHQTLSEEFIREFQHRVDWDCITAQQNLSESFFREFQHLISWRCISSVHLFSDEFINEFYDKFDWEYIQYIEDMSRM